MSINPLKSAVPAANAGSTGAELIPLNVALISFPLEVAAPAVLAVQVLSTIENTSGPVRSSSNVRRS